MKQEFSQKRMDRRAAIKWMFAATATVNLLDAKSYGQRLVIERLWHRPEHDGTRSSLGTDHDS